MYMGKFITKFTVQTHVIEKRGIYVCTYLTFGYILVYFEQYLCDWNTVKYISQVVNLQDSVASKDMYLYI